MLDPLSSVLLPSCREVNECRFIVVRSQPGPRDRVCAGAISALRPCHSVRGIVVSLRGGNRTPAPRPGHRTPHTRMPHARDTASAIRTSVAQRDRDRADLCHRRDASIDPVRLTAPGGSPPPGLILCPANVRQGHRSGVGTRIDIESQSSAYYSDTAGEQVPTRPQGGIGRQGRHEAQGS